jgi:diguanylate cyclase (GGDEF)-like protein
MTDRSENLSGVTHEDIVLARRLAIGSIAILLAERRHAQQELEKTKAQMAQTETQLAEARADSYDRLTGLPLPSLVSRYANEMFLHIGGDRLIDPIGAVGTQTDIVGFKEINQKLKWEGGNSFIRTKSDFLRVIVRDTDLLARWGGDEFVILSPIFRESSAEEVIGFLDERLSKIPQSANFAKQIRWNHTPWNQGDDLESMLARIDITTDEGKAKAKTSMINPLYSVG